MSTEQRIGRRPLDGVQVVEVGVWHAGPGAGAILADLGAEVVKVEALAGEPERYQGNFGNFDNFTPDIDDWTPLYELSNRNKRGMCLDIATPEGQEILAELVAGADVFLSNLREPSKNKLAIDYASIRSLNEQIIYLNVSGFGPAGPMAEAGGFDPLGQALSGMLYLSGKDQEPRLPQRIILDQLTAISAAFAAVTALHCRERDGIGQEVHVSLYGSAIWLTHMNLLSASISGVELDNNWVRTTQPPLRTTYQCGDGEWIMGTNHPEVKFWTQFCEAIDRRDLLEMPRFATRELRIKNNTALFEIVDAELLRRPRDEWLRIFEAHGLLFTPVKHTIDVLDDEQALANGYIVDMEHRDLGSLRVPGFPVHFSEYGAGRFDPAPRLGEHTDEILAELGRSPDEVARLRSNKVVK
ncbi:CaiB/BaiF CoA-transferase family protein [Amycolatopsis sp. GM8]|uniref:CaiB/BaiF CoA transferase family protein n=1 Tax=Amycolatopsis sp. GM8 TaxID=2896530 RepID=UPI001F42717C|nr:CoA transferase [Amycolatopsis sp. GM8]